MHDQLLNTVIYLSAAVIAVSLFERIRIGAILGYLVAGVVIGPYGFALIANPEDALHLAELGVVMMLFVIGLELSPQALWRMRNWIALLGSSQLVGTAAVILLVLYMTDTVERNVALMIGLGLALSSTAFAVQLMSNYRILNTQLGQKGFAILLFQDMAVIPILLLVEILAGAGESSTSPGWVTGLAAIIAVLLGGRYLLNPLLRLVANYGSTELMTAASLLIVLGTALIIEAVGLSMAMGAFLAGILLANSSFRHQLETEIDPFKGLLLGLFFIAIGMSLDLSLLSAHLWLILGCASALVILKTFVIGVLGKLTGSNIHDSMRLGLMLSQGGEFAFVVMAQAMSAGVVSNNVASMVSITVGISMAMTSPLILLYNKLFAPPKDAPANYDSSWDESEPEVLIAGFGRIGQIVGRILTANGIRFTALDSDADQIEFVRRFGNKVFFGDPTRLDLLEAAGLRHAKVLMVAIDDAEDALRVVKMVRRECPHIRIISRSHNRVNLLKQRQAGADVSVRETFGSSLDMARSVLTNIGVSDEKARVLTQLFMKHDEGLIEEALKHPVEVDKLIEIGTHGREELELLFKSDKGNL